MKYYLVVGEASGDLHASNLMKELKKADPAAEFRYYGGDKMCEVGGTLVRHYRDLAYMGFVPVLLHAPVILNGMRQCKRDIRSWNPDVLILVDYPGFNLNIASYVKAHTDIPIFYYIAPKIWAWKEHRIKRIKRDVDELFSILPFEIDFFEKKHNFPIHYVGNPCVNAVQAAEKELATTPCPATTIAVLPGSRKQEIKDNLAIMVRAASYYSEYKIVVAAAPNIDLEYYRRFIPQGIKADIVGGQTYRILNESVVALVTSGTATLETAILRIPQVVCYYTPLGPIVRRLRRRFLKVRYISLVNLILGKEAVPEFVADHMRADYLADYLYYILPGGAERADMIADYEKLKQKLGPSGASERAAQIMVRLLRTKYNVKR